MPGKRANPQKDRKFRLLFEEHPQPMWLIDRGGTRLLEANAAAAALSEHSVAQLRNIPIADLLGGDQAVRFSQQVQQPARAASAVYRQRTSKGRAIDVEMAVHEIEHLGEKAALVVLMDVTGRSELEEQLRQAQKMEAVGMLAGGVAHDFNNLLTIITGYGQMVLKNLGPDDANRHSVEQIMKAGDRAAALTRQLLAFSRRQVLQPKVLDLNQLVGSLSTMLRRLIGEDIDLRLELARELGRVNADPGQIEQVLMNLVVNARDAMPSGGTLTIQTQNVELDDSYAHRHVAVRSGPYVMVTVGDTGTGMDEATRARLFEPFFTTKTTGKGTGLGLSTVFGIVKQSGGSLDVYSEPGHGTSVTVYLPRIDQPVALENEEGSKITRRGSETVLLVEDDEMVRALVRETLLREGYRVVDAADPIQARRVAHEHRGKIQLLITDVVMPKLNGRELADQLLREHPQLKVLYMSGYTDTAIVNSGLLQKEVAFLQKPFTPVALAEKVREVLENGGKRSLAAE